MKKNTIIRLCGLLALCTLTFGAMAEEKGSSGLEYLAGQLEEPAKVMLRDGEDVEDIYSELEWKSGITAFPEKFDLRELGLVTPVKDQSPWGTCWSFGTVAASESSILSQLGQTCEDYEDAFGEPLDLSERHLAWFMANPLPAVEDYPEGEYPFDPSQAGEGFHNIENTEVEPLNMGGNKMFSNATIAAGMGLVRESDAPYTSNQGTLSSEDDWSLPESMRFLQAYALKDANVLPNPAGRDADGNYVYQPEGTEAMKSELLKGRAVGIVFAADQSVPKRSMEDRRKAMEKYLAARHQVSESDKQAFINARVDPEYLATLSDAEVGRLVTVFCRLIEMDENTYDVANLDRDTLEMLLKSRYFGKPVEEIKDKERADAEIPVYMNYLDTDPVIYAQYTYNPEHFNHEVCVVGWDDTFPATNFLEGHQPPADGAWIVKEIPHNPGSRLAGDFQPSAACKFLDLPPAKSRAINAEMQAKTP